jgi:hypothetical protein
MRNNISVYHNGIRIRSCSFYIKLKGYTDIQFRDPLRLHAFYVWRVAITLSFVTAGYNHGRPWEVLGPIVLWKAYSVLCVLEQSRVDNSSAGFNWEQLVQSASGRLLWPFNFNVSLYHTHRLISVTILRPHPIHDLLITVERRNVPRT